MLQIAISVAVAVWFAINAKKRGKNPIIWVIVGAVSYYLPSVIFGRYIYPGIIGQINYDDLEMYLIIGVLLSIAVGVACCLAARAVLIKSG